jgi:hypothetical protein
MTKARKISVAMNGPSPSTMRIMNAMIPKTKDTKRRRRAGLSVAEHVFGDSVSLELILETERRCSSGEESSSESS